MRLITAGGDFAENPGSSSCKIKLKMDQELKHIQVKEIFSTSRELCLYSSVSAVVAEAIKIRLSILMSQIQVSFSENPERFSH